MSSCKRSIVRSAVAWPTAVLALFAMAAAVPLSTPAAKADTVAQYSNFTGSFPPGQPVGQSVTTASGGPWDSLSFNFIDDSSNPYASGNLYVLSQVYAGTPAALSAATPGFIGVAAASGGVWTFAPSLILHSSTQYFFYMDSNITSSIALEVPGNYAGGTAYSAASTTRNYGPTSGDLDFLLSGTQTNPGPLPGSGLLSYLMLGFGSAAAFRKRLRARVVTLLATLKLGTSGRLATS